MITTVIYRLVMASTSKEANSSSQLGKTKVAMCAKYTVNQCAHKLLKLASESWLVVSFTGPAKLSVTYSL